MSRANGENEVKASPETGKPFQARNSKSRSLFSLDILVLMALSLIFGGCCINVVSFESLLRMSPSLGTTITFGQMVFVTCHSLPHFLVWDKISYIPRLSPRQVPLRDWIVQVCLLTTGSLLNNWSFAYNVPLTLQIVFRSSGLPVSMLLGRLSFKRRYSFLQMFSVLIVTFGVVLATVSKPSKASSALFDEPDNYSVGILMLSVSLLLTGVLGVLQERTYQTYGPCWKEGVFYTHLLSLPLFLFLWRDIIKGHRVIRSSYDGRFNSYILFTINLTSQLVCVSGVNQLASRVSSVSTNLVLTVRKAISLCLSVILFRSEWNMGLVLGAFMVFVGSGLYALV